jgi:hypothetical protein
MAQGDVAWFIFRLCSLTSSTVDRVARARASEIFPDHPMRRAYDVVFEHLGLTRLLPDEEEEPDSLEGDGSLEDERSDDGNTRDDDPSSDQDPVRDDSPEGIAKGIIEALNVETEEAKPWFIEERLPTLSQAECEALLNLHRGGERIAKMNLLTIKKHLKEWAQGPDEYRAFHFMTIAQLKEAVRELLGAATGERARASGPMPSRKPELLQKLAQLTNAANERRANGEDDDDSIQAPDPLLLQVFKASHMKPITGAKAKAYCRQGHENERPFMEELLKHSQEGLTGPIKIRGVHGAPLVAIRDTPSVKDSSDGIATYYEEGSEQSDDEGDYDTKILPIEVKSRIASSTFFRERRNLESVLGAAAWENGEPVYAHIDAEDRQLHAWIPKESENFQLLHHVACYDADKGLILVGNNKKVMFGVFVTYSKRLKDAYMKILEDLYVRALRWAYRPIDEMPLEEIEKVLKSEDFAGLRMSKHSFLTSFHIWRKVAVDRGDDSIRLPLPPCNRILPYNHSFWNNAKGGSDTITRLFWNILAVSSVPTPQGSVLGRMFQLFAVALHRMNHVSSAKQDLSFYASTYHYRHCRNEAWPFHKTVNELVAWFLRHAHASEAASAITPIPRPFPVSLLTPPLRIADARTTRTRAAVATERVDWMDEAATGGTPGQGVARDLLHNTGARQQHQSRLDDCPPGFIFVKVEKKVIDLPNGRKKIEYKDKIRKCSVCNTNTRFYCTLCKQYYCMVDRSEKLGDLVDDNSPLVAFLEGERSRPILKAKTVDPKKGIVEEHFFRNSCYHIRHRKGLAKVMKSRKEGNVVDSEQGGIDGG